ncbi:LPS export ABC transporter permease LptG [Pseudomonas sp. Marseille-QA0892]
MSKLDRYIGRSVFLAILSVLGVITALALVFAFIDQLGDVRNDYGLIEVVWYVLLTAPRRIYEMLPMAALIGSMIGLGTLASNSELTIMRAAGVSIGRIVWAVMKPMMVLLIAGVLVGEYVAPWTENKAQGDRSLAQGGGEAQGSRYGYWHRQGDQFVHINSVQPNGVLYGITRYEFDGERKLLWSSFANRATYQQDHWQLEDIVTTRFHGQSTEAVHEATENWDLALNPGLLGTVMMEPETLSISGLWGYSGYLTAQGLNNGQYMLAFWTKLLQPLVTAALVLMAISFVFGPLRSVTLGQRIFTGVVVGFVFRITQDLLGPASLVFNFSPLFAVLIPAGACALAGCILLRRAG